MDAECVRLLAAREDKTAYERVKSRGGMAYYNTPCMIMVTINDSHYSKIDCGIVSQNIALTAHSLGLGNVINDMAGIPFNGPRGEEFKKRCGFQEGYKHGIAVLVGEAKSGKAPHELDYGKVSYISGK
jgi:hypothetical protein